MTLSPDLTASAAPSPAAVLARTCHAEWERLWSVRSTWWFALATAVAVVGIGTLLGLDVRGDAAEDQPDGSAWTGGQLTATFGLFGVLALAVINATADHGTGGIVPTLQATPRRGILLAARTGVIVATTTALGLALVTVASLVIYALVPALGLPAGEGARTLGSIAFVYATGSLLAVGLGLLTRSTAAGLVLVIALVLVLPILLGNLPFAWSQDLARLMPGAGAIYLLVGEGMPGITVTSARLTLGLWAAGALTAGGLRLLRSDAVR